jgi:hypothetical protein
MAEKKQVFATLSAINVKEKIERKNNLDYLSWANAWDMLKQVYPTAQRIVYEHAHTGLNYFTDGNTAYVKVGIVVDNIEHVDYLPVMDYRNNSIPISKITSMDVTKAIQRSTAKAIALHGLGLSLWTGEDLPEIASSSTPIKSNASSPTKSQVVKGSEQDAQEDVKIELNIGDENWEKVLSYVNANKAQGIKKIGAQLNRKYNISKEAKEVILTIIVDQ